MKSTTLVSLARSASYNEAGKNNFRKSAMHWLRTLAKALELDIKDYEVRFNAGGIAVSGEAILHHDKFYVMVGESGVMWRTCNGRKDYTGGPNQWLVGFGGHGNDDLFIDEIKRVMA